MWGNKTVSVVLMTYAERHSIRDVILDFYGTGLVDEVLVVDNNAERGTMREVALTPARLVREKRQGYGFASRRGLADAIGDIVVLAEPDGTFAADDIKKLLAYSDDFDVVFGSRTHPQLIHPGANMPWHLRLGNVLVGKLLSIVFRGPPLTDVGCTYRLLNRRAVTNLLPLLNVGGSQFGPELMAHTLLSGLRSVEVPLHYLPRVGVSSVTGNHWRATLLGLQMIALIFRIRVQSLRRRETVDLPPVPQKRSLPQVEALQTAFFPASYAGDDEVVIDLRASRVL